MNSIDYIMSEVARKDIIVIHNKFGNTDEIINLNYFEAPTILFRYSSINEYLIESLTEYPQRGRKVPEANRDEIREVFLDEYRIIYRTEKSKIIVLN